jgi:hypothetical protein
VMIPLIPISNMSSLSVHHELKFQAAMEPTKKKKQNRRFLCTQIQVLIQGLHWNLIGIFVGSQYFTYGCATQVGLNRS